MSNMISFLRIGKHMQLIAFQKDILVSNKSLQDMYQYLYEKCDIEYILTFRLNKFDQKNCLPTLGMYLMFQLIGNGQLKVNCNST